MFVLVCPVFVLVCPVSVLVSPVSAAVLARTYVLSWLSLPPSGVAYPLDGTPDGTPDAEAAVRSADLTSLLVF